MPAFAEFDVVEVVKLLTPDRNYQGTEATKRPPRVGDRGTIVHRLDPTQRDSPLVVECVDQAGCTVWLAEFAASELRVLPDQ